MCVGRKGGEGRGGVGGQRFVVWKKSGGFSPFPSLPSSHHQLDPPTTQTNMQESRWRGLLTLATACCAATRYINFSSLSCIWVIGRENTYTHVHSHTSTCQPLTCTHTYINIHKRMQHKYRCRRAWYGRSGHTRPTGRSGGSSAGMFMLCAS